MATRRVHGQSAQARANEEVQIVFGDWWKWSRFKWIPIAVAAVWLVAVWVQIILKPQGDFPNHWKMGSFFASGVFIYKDGLNFVYPPLWAMAHAALAFMGPHAAQVLAYPLALLSIIVLVQTLRTLSDRHFPISSDALFWATTFAILLAVQFLTRDLPEIGVNTALVALSWLAILLWSRKRDVAAGGCLGLAAALKCTPLLFIAWFALKREWKMVACSVAWLALFTLSPVLFLGPAEYFRAMNHWGSHVIQGMGDADPSHGPLGEEKVENLSLRPALARYLMHLPYGHLGRPESSDTPGRASDPPSPFYLQFLDLPPVWAGVVTRAVMAALLLWIVRLFRHRLPSRDAEEVLWEGAAVSLLLLLFSPITWMQHCTGVLPALYFVCRAALSGVSFPRWTMWAMGTYTLFAVVLNRSVVGKEATKLLNAYRTKTLAFLLLLCVVLAFWHHGASPRCAQRKACPEET